MLFICPNNITSKVMGCGWGVYNIDFVIAGEWSRLIVMKSIEAREQLVIG